ncbi:DUF1214 domain-containing protein [Marimonas sp. MJW-29]|uniref:DUF1214 domain-containing protein n=1 Tax=Sulfitobacter sediminis TaxID=3234186 RepID=A0ABV3RIC6_9RHOB
MKRILVAVLCGVMSAPAALAEIPEIDSSDWATDPRDYGMTAKEYIQAESRAFFADFIGRVGLNTFYHFPGVASAEDRFVVSPNNDTVYSVAVVNVTEGFTLELPETGDRFVSVHIVDENHMSPFYLYGGGTREFTADQFETEYVAVGIRTGTDASEEDVRFIKEELHPNYAITGASNVDEMPRPDLDVLARVRSALVAEYGKLSTTSGAMQPRTELVEDWEFFTYVTAGAWGLSADENAMYAPYALPEAIGGKCYTATYPPVPVKAFFSITVYGAEKYLMSNVDNIVSSNRGVETNDDGSFTVAFGGEECRELAPNYVYTPDDGWSLLLRAYRPEVEEFQAYEMPELTPVE